MTANIGSLAVSLSLDANSFNGSMQQVDRNLRAMGSELKAVQARGSAYGNSIEGLSSRQDILRRSLDASNIKLTDARRKYDEMVASGTASEAQLERQARRVNEAQAQYNRLETELNEVSQALQLQSSSWYQLSQRMESIGSNLTAVGDKMKTIGRDLSMKVTAPIVGLGTAAVKAGADFEEGMSKVAAVSGATGEDFNRLREMAKKLGAETKYSATEAAFGMEKLALAGWKADQIVSAMPGMLNLAAAGALDLSRAADITSDVMSAFGISAEKAGHAADVFAYAQANANTNVEMMGEAMTYLAPVANALGWELEESAAAIMKLADSGVKGSMAGQAFATSLARLAKPTKRMGKEMKSLGMDFFDAQGNIKTLPEVMAEVEKGTKGMTKEQKSATLSILFGAEAYKHWAILLESGSDVLAKTTDELKNADGAAEKMAKTMNDNLKGEIKTLLSALEGLAIKISETLIPIVRDMASKLTEWTRKFAALSPEAQKTILVIGGIAAAIGPLLVIGGTLVSSIGSIVTVVGSMSGAIAAAGGASAVLGGALTVLTGPIGLTVGALTALTVGGIALYKHLKKDAIPAVDRFGEGVSENTKKALEGFFELSDGASLKLKELTYGQQRMTDEMATGLIESFSKMNDQILTKMDERHSQELEKLQNHFLNSSALTDAEEQNILAKIDQRNNDEAERQKMHGERIKEILEAAAAEKRQLTEREQKVINQIQQQMNETAVNYLSQSEVESKIILEKMKQTAGDITARQAAEVVANSNKQKTEAVKEAESQYEETIAQIIKMRDESKVITAEQADKMIAEATKQRDQTVKLAEDMHTKVVNEAKKQAGEHINHVNWETGEILSKWEVFKDKVGKTMEATVTLTKKYFKMASDDVREKVETMRTNAELAFDRLKNTASQKIEEMKESIKSKMDNARENIQIIWGKAEKFLSEINLIQIGKDIVQGLIDGISSKAEAVWDKAKEMGQTVIDSVSNVLQRRSPSRVMIAIGKDVGEGLAIGIDSTRELNETAMKELGQLLINTTKEQQKEISFIASTAQKDLIKIQNDAASSKQSIEKKLASDIYAIEVKATSKKRILNEAELNRIATLKSNASDKLIKIEQDTQKKIKEINQKTQSSIAKKEENAASERLNIIKQYIADKDSLNQLSLTTETYILEQSLKLFKDGTVEKIEIQKMYKKATEEINKEAETINKTYLDNVKQLNDEYIKEEERLTKVYQDEFEKRRNAYYSFAGLFDEVAQRDVSGATLIAALQSQVTAFEDWQKNITNLASKGINEGLLAELQAMGPKAGAEIAALNTLTEEQLAEYTELWKTKNEQARKQAESELTHLKQNTEKQINELRLKTSEQLRIYQNDWRNSMIALKGNVKIELAEMPNIGVFAVSGLIDGMMSKQGALINAAQSLADIVSSTFKTALDINSPSRVMRGYGVNIGEGLVQGFNDMITKAATERLAYTVSGTKLSNLDSTNKMTSSSTSNVVNNYNMNYHSPKPLDPYESARLTRNSLKEVSLQI